MKWLIGFCSVAALLASSCVADKTVPLRQKPAATLPTSADDEARLAESLEALWKLRPSEADDGDTYYISFSERPSTKDPSTEVLQRLAKSLSREVRPVSEASITLDHGVVDRRSGKRGVLLYAYVDAVRPGRHMFVIAGLFDTGKSGQEWLLMFTRLNENTWSLRQACLLGVS